MSRPNLSTFPQPQLPTPIPAIVYYTQPPAPYPIQTHFPPENFPANIPPSDQPPPPPPPSSTAIFPAPPTSSQHPDQQYKNRLQEFAQKLNVPLPLYETVNEGFAHAPQFRSTVFVDGVKFMSPKTFWTRKAAEKFVAELALQHLSQKKIEEDLHQDFSLIQEETIFCKSILHELASKVNMETPTYNTVKSEGLLPTFISSLVFNGVHYSGGAGKSKKEAEQLAARAVIMSLLDAPTMGLVLRDIIKSKGKLYAALQNVNNPATTVPLPVNAVHSSALVKVTGIGAEGCIPPNNAPAPVTGDGLPKVVSNAAVGAAPVGNVPPSHEFKLQATSISEPASASSQAARLPIEFVHSSSAHSADPTPTTSKRRRKNKKKEADKRLCMGAE